MIPGPVSTPPQVLAAMQADYPSGDVEPAFFDLYEATAAGLAGLMGTRNDVVIMTGEGMLVLWAALKSCLKAGDRVLAVANGIFGEGLGDMAAGLGCEVRKLRLPHNQSLGDNGELEALADDFAPDMITAVHCETPSGTLNPLELLGRVARRRKCLLCVDAVSSIGGMEVLSDACSVDLLLGSAQKCLSAPPSMSFLSVSPAAWERVERTGYQGYDALAPWRGARGEYGLPYTPYWHGMAALHAAVELIAKEGTANVFARHEQVARQCREGLQELGIRLWPAPGSLLAPTVSVAHLPDAFDWKSWNARLRTKGLAVGGGFDTMNGKIFRIGHMGTQANAQRMQDCLARIRAALQTDKIYS